MKNCSKVTRIEIYLSEDLKVALQTIANRQGMPLSKLVVRTLINTLIHPIDVPPEKSLEKIEQRILKNLEKIENRIQDPRVEETDKPLKRPVITPIATKSPVPVVALGTGEKLPIDQLIERFKGDRAMKARLCLVGGKKLFEGNYDGSMKVAEMTSKYDPEGKSWMPIDQQRRNWVQIEPKEWILRVLEKE